MGLKLADYVVTEAGFGSDLGATKFLDIKSRIGGLSPSCIVLNTTIRSLKYNAGITKEEVEKPNLGTLKKGIVNLDAHLDLLSHYTSSIVVCINHFIKDTEEEINYVKKYVEDRGFTCEVSTSFEEGGKGSQALAQKIIESCHKQPLKTIYNIEDSIENKIESLVTNLLHSKVTYTDEALENIRFIEKHHLDHYPICIAKTPYSLCNGRSCLGGMWVAMNSTSWVQATTSPSVCPMCLPVRRMKSGWAMPACWTVVLPRFTWAWTMRIRNR